MTKRNMSPFALLGILTATIGLLLTIGFIWEIIDFSNEIQWKITSIISIVSFSIAHSSLLLLAISRDKIINIISLITIFAIVVVATILIIFIIINRPQEEFYYRILGTFGVLDALGTILIPILFKIRNKV